MRVVCSTDNFLEIKYASEVDRTKKYLRLSDGQLNLEKGGEYCVYGITFRDNTPWYYICLGEDDDSPTAYPANLFSISDGRLSSYWRLSVNEPSLVIEDWASDPSFYERLVDGDPLAIQSFRRFRALMDTE